MAKARKSKIEKIDKNFQPATDTAALKWVDGFDSKVAIRGLGWLSENRKARNYRRFPDRVEATLSEGLKHLTHCPASVFLSFFSDTDALGVRVKNAHVATMAHMPSTGSDGVELYMRQNERWIPVATGLPDLQKPAYERLLLRKMPRVMREYRLYLPLYANLDSVSVGFAAGAVVKPSPVPPDVKPILVYGTSITQGACASTAGSDFVSILGRVLGTEIINLGFSGCGKGEPEVARVMREVDAEMFVLDYATNCTWDRVRDTLPEFVRLLTEKHPHTPIVLVGSIGFSLSLWEEVMRVDQDRRRTEVLRFYLQEKDRGKTNIYYIDGDGLLTGGITGAFVDGGHPTSHGLAIMAERLAPLLGAIRIWNPPSAARSRRKKS